MYDRNQVKTFSVIYAGLLAIALILFFTACGHTDYNSYTTPPAVPSPSPLPSPTPATQTTVEGIVANENAYREGLGQTELSLGLSCTVQAISAGQFLSSSSPGYTAAQAIVLTGPAYPYLLTIGINQPNSNSGPNNVIDPSIQPLFLTNNYRIVCTGQLVVTEDGYHSFVMSSDDGSILTIDGTQVINNDGNHGITTLSGTKNLRSDVVHTFNLQYAQSGAGQFALVLNMDGALLPAANLYH